MTADVDDTGAMSSSMRRTAHGLYAHFYRRSCSGDHVVWGTHTVSGAPTNQNRQCTGCFFTSETYN